MDKLFKGYDSWNRNVGKQEFGAHYQDLSQALGDTAAASVQVANGIYRQRDEDERLLRRLEHQSESATGRMQAIQAGNQISAQTVRQLQKVQELLSAQIQVTSALVQAENERQAAAAAQDARFKARDLPPSQERSLKRSNEIF
jgi:P-type conjugative transfer protein TrbJ